MTLGRALITGCSTGIGRATALELMHRGYEVVATARRLESIADLEVTERLFLDVDSDASVAAVLAAAGRIDVLINNAGLGVEGSVEELPLEDVRRAFETNFFGPVRMIQAFLPAMRERASGAIVNVTSVAGIAAPPLAGYYAATKFALEALSESLSFEVGHFGVKVLIVEPGGIATEFGANMMDHRGKPGPYSSLASQWEGATTTLRAGQEAPGPDLVARAIAEALAAEHSPLRLPVGADAELVSASRASMDFASFQEAMRAVLQIDW